MTGNFHLNKAMQNKNDEFYTFYKDIENIVPFFKKRFENKIVYCNCDDPSFSNFWNYFHNNFTELKLKKLISTHLNSKGSSYKKEYEGGKDEDVSIGKETPLIFDGAFQNYECLNILRESDIVCTNPPFSLFRLFFENIV